MIDFSREWSEHTSNASVLPDALSIPVKPLCLVGDVSLLLRTQIVEAVADVRRSLRPLGLPMSVSWVHLELMFPGSTLSFTLGQCFHFKACMDAKSRVVVSGLYGARNPADLRRVDLRSADELRKFLLGETCRQVVLTFGDIAASTARHSMDEHFEVKLVPPAIRLYPMNKTQELGIGEYQAPPHTHKALEVAVTPDQKVRFS